MLYTSQPPKQMVKVIVIFHRKHPDIKDKYI
ncbi:hypothetical protein CMTB2_04037 [Caminibacter mediatlanticus TB-2]|uniref:Uncharacterized protein n=1 Tax=Caminibacter mediatlanticus TB-2 TaxID=391592 RepID=A0AAI9F1M2_9BACT|nr:hypothetical protein CMTB2_04037 [Caminibacter mediatlanticus TB-2]